MTSEYDDMPPITRTAAVNALNSGDPEAMSLALIRSAFHDPDWRWVQEQCLRLSTYPNLWVQRNCATCLGHIARLHGQLDTARVIPVLDMLAQYDDVASWAEAALEDVAVFIQGDGGPT